MFVRNMNVRNGHSVRFSWENPRRLLLEVFPGPRLRKRRSFRVPYIGGIRGVPPIDGDTAAVLLLGTEMGTAPISGGGSFLQQGVHALDHHQERVLALRLFKCGNSSVLVVTDVAARGLIFDLANDISDAARHIGCTGIAFCNDDGIQPSRTIAENRKQLMQGTNQEVPDWLLHHESYASYRLMVKAVNRQFGCDGRFRGNDFRREGDFNRVGSESDPGSSSACGQPL